MFNKCDDGIVHATIDVPITKTFIPRCIHIMSIAPSDIIVKNIYFKHNNMQYDFNIIATRKNYIMMQRTHNYLERICSNPPSYTKFEPISIPPFGCLHILFSCPDT